MGNVSVLPLPKLPRRSIVLHGEDWAKDGSLGNDTIRRCDRVIELLSGGLHLSSPVLLSAEYSPQKCFARKEMVAMAMWRYLHTRGVQNIQILDPAWGAEAETKVAMHAIVKRNLPKDVMVVTSFYQLVYMMTVVNKLTQEKLKSQRERLVGTFAGHQWNFSFPLAPQERSSFFKGLWAYLRCLTEGKEKAWVCSTCGENTIPPFWKPRYVVQGVQLVHYREKCWVCRDD